MAIKLCSVQGCDRPRYNRNKYCGRHYLRLKRYGDLDGGKQIQNNKSILHRTEYQIWTQMCARCRSINDKRYKYYGALGIKVCDRWLGKNGFDNFYLDMGDKPKGKSLDRIDVNGNYCPENCRWASSWEQANNKHKKTLGYCRLKDGRWRAYISVNGKCYQMESSSEEAAIANRQKLIEKYIGAPPKNL